MTFLKYMEQKYIELEIRGYFDYIHWIDNMPMTEAFDWMDRYIQSMNSDDHK